MDRALRKLVWSRARRCCEYCLMPAEFDDATFEIDHIISEKHRGKTVESNLALACFPCNCHKGPNISGIDPESGAMVSLYHPRQQIWREHFRYEGELLMGLTPLGRATVAVLEINLPHRIAHRLGLIEEAVFPPPWIASS